MNKVRPLVSGGGFFERTLDMIGTVIDIDGDYAVIRYDATGTESHVALAIIGDVDIGDKVKFENFSYEKI